MKCSLIFLLIGAIMAIACAAPSRSSLKALEQQMRNIAVNEEMNALNQEEDDEDDDGGDRLVQALLNRIQEKVKAQAEEDALAQFIHLHFGK